MSMTDPIADMLTRIRNAQVANHQTVRIPMSKTKKSIADVLSQAGYVGAVEVNGEGIEQYIEVTLKYVAGREPVIQKITRESKPGRRHYVTKDEIPKVLGGLGLSVISTSKGMLSGQEARKQGVGGELICTVY